MNFPVSPHSTVEIELLMNSVIEYAYQRFGNAIYDGDKLDFDYIKEAIYLMTGYRFVPKVLMPDYCEGITSFSEKTFSISAEEWEEMSENMRARFSIAHEIAHVILHRNQALNFDLMAARDASSLPYYRKSEWQANAGAAALLAPFNRFSCALKRYEIIQDDKVIANLLSVSFGISRECAIRRMNTVRTFLNDPKTVKELNLELVYESSSSK